MVNPSKKLQSISFVRNFSAINNQTTFLTLSDFWLSYGQKTPILVSFHKKAGLILIFLPNKKICLIVARFAYKESLN